MIKRIVEMGLKIQWAAFDNELISAVFLFVCFLSKLFFVNLNDTTRDIFLI